MSRARNTRPLLPAPRKQSSMYWFRKATPATEAHCMPAVSLQQAVHVRPGTYSMKVPQTFCMVGVLIKFKARCFKMSIPSDAHPCMGSSQLLRARHTGWKTSKSHFDRAHMHASKPNVAALHAQGLDQSLEMT